MDDPANTVILDNGAYTAKLGLASDDEPKIIPNCIMKAKAERRRAFVGQQIDECRDASGLFYILCFQKGFLLNWDVQKSVWDHFFSAEGCGFTLEDRNIVITEPQMNFLGIQEAMMEILFEEYHVAGVLKTTTADLVTYQYVAENEPDITKDTLNCLVIDVGYSFSHVIPFVKGHKVLKGIRRIEIGGKVLTNHLKELISYRHLNMMDESYVVNQVKEDCCFVSQNFVDDMRVHTSPAKRMEIVRDYVLPDFTNIRRGYIRNNPPPEETHAAADDADQQFLRLCNERFSVPELLFNPSDVGIQQMGIPEAAIDALKDCPPYTHSELLRNIIVVGGSAKFPGFVERLKAEIRSLAPDDLKVSVTYPKDPIAYGWQGGKELALRDDFEKLLLTREEFEETA